MERKRRLTLVEEYQESLINKLKKEHPEVISALRQEIYDELRREFDKEERQMEEQLSEMVRRRLKAYVK